MRSHHKIERYYFDKFQDNYQLPEGKIEYSDKPDVIIHGDNLLGIEIVNLYISPRDDDASEQVQHPRRLKILERAQTQYFADRAKRFELSADFNPYKPISFSEIDQIAQELAKLAQCMNNKPSGLISRRSFMHIPQLRSVYINTNEYLYPKWKLMQCHKGAPPLSFERLREEVMFKNEKVKSYQPCDVYWLLIIVDVWNRGQDQEIVGLEDIQLCKVNFERVLLYRPPLTQVVEIKQQ